MKRKGRYPAARPVPIRWQTDDGLNSTILPPKNHGDDAGTNVPVNNALPRRRLRSLLMRAPQTAWPLYLLFLAAQNSP